jgi:Zn-dependent peptidase ImmA (M78 family)
LQLAPIAPLDPRLLAKHLGITIWTPAGIPGMSPKDVHHLTVMARESWSAATLRNAGDSLIIINSAHALTRQNNSLAHEIGHIVLKHEPAQMYVTDDGLMMMSEYNLEHEEEADWFAGAVLLPRDALLDVSARGMSPRAAAGHFGVSLALYQMRRNRTGVDIQFLRRRGVWAP